MRKDVVVVPTTKGNDAEPWAMSPNAFPPRGEIDVGGNEKIRMETDVGAR